jgi:DNA-binding NarL/FixJ family response regulator
MKQINIAIADDQQLVLEGIRMLADKIKNIKVIITATEGYDLLAQLARAPKLPDLVMLDLEMPGPGGKNTLTDIRMSYKSLKVLIVSGYKTPAHIASAFRQGANGYVTKNVSPEELEKAIRITIENSHYLCPCLAAKMTDYELNLITGRNIRVKDLKPICSDLSPFDLEIIKHISIGLTSKEIADTMNVSVRTIEGRRQKILQKTGCVNAVDLIINAKLKGWCD